MPFSASTCLTNAGTTPLGPVLSAYTDTDAYLNPFASVLLTQITGSSCPYIFTNIPDGTTNIRLIDPTNSCCITIPIQSDNFCNTCDLGFTTYSSQTNSQIIAGDLTGSCQANISDYVINWFGPNNATNIAFKSGKGNTFSYQFTHPLTGSGFVFAQAGTYTPVIDRVIISGITFSNTGGTGTYDATLDCFNSVQVNPLTCDNGNTPTSAYTHSYYFSGTGASSIPLNVTFQLSNNTNYFAYSFTGQSIVDNLKIFYNGINTNPTQMVLENISVGSDNTGNFLSASDFPKLVDFTFISRVLSLTGITNRNINDTLTIQITPNAGNTEWSLNLRCFSTFSCSNCVTDSYKNEPMKIIKSTINVTSAECQSNFAYSVSACNISAVTSTNIPIYYSPSTGPTSNFFQTSTASSPVSTSNNGIVNTQNGFANFSYTSSSCSTGGGNPANATPTCNTSLGSSNISFIKYLSGSPQYGVIDIYSTNPSHITHYFNSYNTAISSTANTWFYSACTQPRIPYPGAVTVSPSSGPIAGPFSGGSWTGGTSITNPTDIRYYRSIALIIPTATGATACGLNTTESGGVGFNGNVTGGLFQYYHIHTSATVTTGFSATNSSYYMRIIMPTISNGKNFLPCQISCPAQTNGIVNTNVNNFSTGVTYANLSFNNTSGDIVNLPFITANYLIENCNPTTAYTVNLSSKYSNISELTIPLTTAGAALPQYSGTVCNWNGNYTLTNSTNYLTQFNCTTIFYPTGPKDFEVYCSTISNWVMSATQTLAYRYSGGSEVFCNSTFVVGC